jgi:RNA polymerase sigma-70 factor, ECF subfamily
MALHMLEQETTTIPDARRIDRDGDLLEALQGNAPSAAERLVAIYGDRAYRLAMRITGNTSDAEEVVQDAFLAVTRKVDSFRGDSAFGSWIYRIVANAACQKVRGRRKRQADVSWDEVMPVFDERGRHVSPVTDWSTRVEDPIARRELRAALTAAIEELPEIYRMVLVLRDVEGMSNLEVADALALNIPVVKARLHRARLFLRKRLSEVLEPRDA